jgi:hypothetical protein
LELKFDEPGQKISYRWNVDEPDFAMPVRVGKKDQWQLITPTHDWQTMECPLSIDEFDVATDLYYISVHKL